MANKYLDETGLSYFWGKVKAFFAPDTNPLAPGTANKGTSSKFARQDHVHPLQTTVSGNAGSATKLATARTIDGVDFDGSAAIIHFGSCSTAAATTEKAVACTSYKLVTGSWIAVKFTVTNTGAVGSLTLNVNTTGAKAIKYRGANLPSASTLTSGRTYMFVYDGTNYELIGDLDTNTTYTPASATPLMDGTGAVGSSAKYAREDHVHPSDTSKVDKEAGKGLSTNDYTTTEKNKLAGIAAGAEVNQNAFSNVKVGSTTIAADGKTDTLELAAGTNITLTPDATNDKVTITAATISPYTSNPAMDGTASAGSSANYSRGDHVHPTDTSRAALASPTFTGTPKAPTASAGTNTTQIATTAFVTTAVANAQVGAATFQGTVSSNSTISDSAYKKGWYWVVATAGTYVGETCEVGDMIFAINDKGSAYAASDFSVVQSNLDLVAITNGEIDNIVA